MASIAPRSDRSSPLRISFGYIRRDLRIVVALIVLSSLLRLFNLGKEPLWYDEAGTWLTTSRPVVEQWNWNEPLDKGNPPLFFTIVTGWRKLFGDSEAALRGVSALSSIATVPVVFYIARDLGGPVLGIGAGLLMAISPFNVRYAQEARTYAFMSFVLSVAMLALVRVLHAPPLGTGRPGWWTERRYWIVLGAANAIALLSHNTAVFPVSGLFIAAAWIWGSRIEVDRRRSFAANAALALAITTAGWAIWWPGLWTQFGTIKDGFWIPRPTVEHIVGSFYPVYAGSVVRDELARTAWEVRAVAVMTLLIVAIGANALWRWRGNAVTFAIMTVLTVTMPLAMIVTSLWTPILLPRTVLWLTVPATVVIAFGTLGSGSTALRRWGFAALVGVNLYGLWNYHAHFRKESWREVAALVAQQYREGDAIVFCRGNLEIPFNYILS